MKTLSITVIALAMAAMTATAQVKTTKSENEVSNGRLEHFDLYSTDMQRDMPVDVWLPAGYDAERAQGYPVIYMHDGQNLFDASRTWNKLSWEIDSVVPELIAAGEIETPIIVAVYSRAETRVGDLMPNGMVDIINPELAGPTITSKCPGGICGNKYIDFIASTLKPMIDATYNTRIDAESTSVMGSSMGGLISLGAICERPDVFGSAACLSTHIIGMGIDSVFPTAVNAYLIGHLPLDGKHRIYIDRGDQDLDGYYVPYFPAFAKTFTDLGYREGENFCQKTFPGHSHSESSWKLRVAEPIKFLLKK